MTTSGQGGSWPKRPNVLPLPLAPPRRGLPPPRTHPLRRFQQGDPVRHRAFVIALLVRRAEDKIARGRRRGRRQSLSADRPSGLDDFYRHRSGWRLRRVRNDNRYWRDQRARWREPASNRRLANMHESPAQKSASYWHPWDFGAPCPEAWRSSPHARIADEAPVPGVPASLINARFQSNRIGIGTAGESIKPGRRQPQERHKSGQQPEAFRAMVKKFSCRPHRSNVTPARTCSSANCQFLPACRYSGKIKSQMVVLLPDDAGQAGNIPPACPRHVRSSVRQPGELAIFSRTLKDCAGKKCPLFALALREAPDLDGWCPSPTAWLAAAVSLKPCAILRTDAGK